MDPVYILLAVIGILVPVLAFEIRDLRKGIANTHSQCDKITEREIVVETKLDIFLDHAGFDVPKVNKTIKEHMNELKKNDKPSVGCINVKELYRTKPEE